MWLEFWQHWLRFFLAFSFSQRKFRLIEVLLHLSQSHPHILMNTRWVHEAASSSVCQATGRILNPKDSQSCSPHLTKYVCTQTETSSLFPSILFLYDPFDTILPSTPRSCKWCSSFWFLCTRFFPPHTWHTPSHVIHLDIVVLVRSTNCRVPHSISPASFSSSHSGPNIAINVNVDAAHCIPLLPFEVGIT